MTSFAYYQVKVRSRCQHGWYSEQLILPFYNIFLPKWSKLIQNGQFWLFCNFFNIFLPKWSKLIQNSQFWLFCNFSNIFLPNWSKLIQNGQFWLFCNFSNIFLPKDLKWPILAVLQLFQYFPTKGFEMANFGCFATFPIFSSKVV